MPPRGMTLNNTFVDKRTQYVPKNSASDHLGVLLRGYLSTRTVMAAEHASEIPLMLQSEDTELRAASLGQAAIDDSLAPRAVGITLLVYGPDPVYCNTVRNYLDGLAHLASTPLALTRDDDRLTASIMRMTILAGPDAAWYAKHTAAQALDTAPTMDNGAVDVCVRWAVPGSNGVLRSEFRAMPTGNGCDQALEAMQNCFLSMKLSYLTPFPDDITTVHANVPNDAWVKSVHNASKAFFEMMEGKPCVHKGELLKQHPEVSIESSGIFVRICPRKLWNHHINDWAPVPLHQSVNRQDAFHAFLVGNAVYLRDIEEHCTAFQQTGLPMPDQETSAFCLHTCAVQASCFHLRDRVSLFATHPRGGGRKPGVPINQPGSWVWRMEPAIVSLELTLTNFYVVPCNRDSVMPGDRKLEAPFNDFFNRAYMLYTNTFGMQRGPRAMQEFERMPLSLPAEPLGADPSVKAAEEYALTAFNLDASSRRMVVGDAFSALSARNAPPQLTELMLQSAVRSGINTSVIDAMGIAAAVLASMPYGNDTRADVNGECERLKRVADCALDMATKAPRTMNVPVEIEAAKVRSLLGAAGLRKGTACNLPRQVGKSKLTAGDFVSVVSVIGSAVIREAIPTAALNQACEAAFRACTNNKRNADLSSIAAAICVLRALPSAELSTAFVVGQTDTTGDAVSFNRVLPNGGYEPTTPGKIVDAPLSSVILLKDTVKGMRVTATVRA